MCKEAQEFHNICSDGKTDKRLALSSKTSHTAAKSAAKRTKWELKLWCWREAMEILFILLSCNSKVQLSTLTFSTPTQYFSWFGFQFDNLIAMLRNNSRKESRKITVEQKMKTMKEKHYKRVMRDNQVWADFF